MTTIKGKSSGPFTALVVDSGLDFREELVSLLHLLGFQVLGSTASYEIADDLLNSHHCDLLITAIDVQAVEHEDQELPAGTVLAYRVHSHGSGKIIFLTNGQESSESLEAAAACQPMAWVSRTGTTMTPRERYALNTVLEQFRAELNGFHQSLLASELIAELGDALAYIDIQTAEFAEMNAAARELLPPVAQDADRQWWKVMGIAHPETTSIAQALISGNRASVDPLALQFPDGTEKIVGGRAVPLHRRGRNQLALMLHELATADDRQYQKLAKPEDVVAVLGVSQLQFDERWSATDLPRLMMEMRAGLLEIARERDHVALPDATTIRIVLRDIDIPGAENMARALLSHLYPVTRGKGVGAQDAVFSIGLAAVGPRPLAALVAANEALLYAQRRSKSDRVRVADAKYRRLHSAGALFSGGLFDRGLTSSSYHQFLDRLSALVSDSADGYIGRLLQLLVAQRGARTVALYRRRFRENHEFCAAVSVAGETVVGASESDLPQVFRDQRKKIKPGLFKGRIQYNLSPSLVLYPLNYQENLLGFLLLSTSQEQESSFSLEASAIHTIARQLLHYPAWRQSSEQEIPEPGPVARPMESTIRGYVGDNMEGAVDQAVFLAGVDMPVAVIGARGTGKMYIARIIHRESGGRPDSLVNIDCREFRGRDDANQGISNELKRSAGRTLVFKSPHLMHPDAQQRLARQLSSRVLADSKPPESLPQAHYVGLFPDGLDHLVRHRGLHPRLAGVFAGYPIVVPPIKDRKQAVLRWAHKILTQECADQGRVIKGFTPDAEQALLQHDWPGNISEMRQCLQSALRNSQKEWLTPVDLGLFKGISAEGSKKVQENRPFLEQADEQQAQEDDYTASPLEVLDTALGRALHNVLETGSVKPLGTWLEDEMVLAALDRYRGDTRHAAEFMHTATRNIGRWLPKIQMREEQRNSAALWHDSARLVRDWVRAVPPPEVSPLEQLQDMLMSHLLNQCDTTPVSQRAKILGVSVPTYQKRLQKFLDG